MPISESQKKALKKYKDKAYDRLDISVPKGKKAEIQAFADTQEQSINAFVNQAIDEAMNKD